MYVNCVLVCVYLLSLLFYVYVCVLFAYSFLYFSSHDDCIVYARMHVHIFSYLVNKIEIWWLYLSPNLTCDIQSEHVVYVFAYCMSDGSLP